MRAARKTDEAINRCIRSLTLNPDMGRIGRVEGTRELVIGRTPPILV
jgi:plasmid stabilization system protein ParE